MPLRHAHPTYTPSEARHAAAHAPHTSLTRPADTRGAGATSRAQRCRPTAPRDGVVCSCRAGPLSRPPVLRLLQYSLGRQWHRQFESCSWLGCLVGVATWLFVCSHLLEAVQLRIPGLCTCSTLSVRSCMSMCIIHSMCPWPIEHSDKLFNRLDMCLPKPQS